MFTVLVAESSLHQKTNVYDLVQFHFHEDCILQQAKTSRELFQFFGNNHADVLLLDMDMPGINCRNVTRLLQGTRQTCIVLPMAELNSFSCSTLSDDSTVMDYLLKPFTDSELVLTLEEALQCCRQQQSASANTDDVSRTDIVRKKIQQYITDHYSEILSMQDVARAMNYSDTHFCRLFKQCFQVNFSVYLNQFRIEQAKQMLAASNLTVKEVSISCGYRDTSYFIRVFKRFTGMTPSDYRMHCQTITAKKYNKS